MARNLAETQELFWRLITAPEGVERAMQTLHISREELEDVFNSDRKFPAMERMDVYANMYFYRILDVLKDDYARVLRLIGDVAFHNLITDYLLVYPSSNPSLRYIGSHLPEFLERHAVTEEYPPVADLARLERARADAFDAPDAEALGAEQLQQFPPTSWANLRLSVPEAVRFLELDWPVHVLWRALKDEKEPPELKAAPTRIRVWRDGNLIYHAPISELEDAALRSFRNGMTLAQTCVALQEMQGDKPIATRIAELLHKWIDEGIIETAELAAEDDEEA